MKAELAYLAHHCCEIDKYRVETCCVLGEAMNAHYAYVYVCFGSRHLCSAFSTYEKPCLCLFMLCHVYMSADLMQTDNRVEVNYMQQ